MIGDDDADKDREDKTAAGLGFLKCSHKPMYK